MRLRWLRLRGRAGCGAAMGNKLFVNFFKHVPDVRHHAHRTHTAAHSPTLLLSLTNAAAVLRHRTS